MLEDNFLYFKVSNEGNSTFITYKDRIKNIPIISILFLFAAFVIFVIFKNKYNLWINFYFSIIALILLSLSTWLLIIQLIWKLKIENGKLFFQTFFNKWKLVPAFHTISIEQAYTTYKGNPSGKRFYVSRLAILLEDGSERILLSSAAIPSLEKHQTRQLDFSNFSIQLASYLKIKFMLRQDFVFNLNENRKRL